MKRIAVLTCAALFAAALCGEETGLRYTLGTGKFENDSVWSGRWNLAEAFGTLLEDQLVQGGRFLTVESAEGKSHAQVSVKGAIVRVEEAQGLKGGGFGFKGISFNPELGAAEVEVSVTVSGSAQDGVKSQKTFTGKSHKGSVPLSRGNSSWSLLTEMPGLEKDRIGGALSDAVNQAASFVESQLGSIVWQGSVAAVKDGKLVVNRGARDGVSVGMKFDVGEMENVVDETSGELLDSEVTTVATVEVVEVKEKISYTTPFEGAKKGMGVYPAKPE